MSRFQHKILDVSLDCHTLELCINNFLTIINNATKRPNSFVDDWGLFNRSNLVTQWTDHR